MQFSKERDVLLMSVADRGFDLGGFHRIMVTFLFYIIHNITYEITQRFFIVVGKLMI